MNSEHHSWVLPVHYRNSWYWPQGQKKTHPRGGCEDHWELGMYSKIFGRTTTLSAGLVLLDLSEPNEVVIFIITSICCPNGVHHYKFKPNDMLTAIWGF